MSFRVYDFRDTDIMARLHELGSIPAADLAAELGANSDKKGTIISSRLSWMKRYGMVGFDPKDRTWRVSEGGARVLESRRKAAAIKAIEALPKEELVEVMAHITSVYRLGDPLLAAMLRREFQYGTWPGR
jgi:hypothetical protein